MSDNFIPRNDAKAIVWMKAFARTLSGDPARYDVSAADAQNITDTVADFADRFDISSEKATRTEVTIQAKDDARAVAEQLCRSFAKRIKANDGISDADKIAAGVRPENPDRQPIHAPDTPPIINVLGGMAGSQSVRYADSTTPNTGRKPFGAQRLDLYCHVGDAPTVNADEARYVGGFTRGPIAVTFEEADDGKVATYFARWASRRGDTSPWSLPVAMRVAA